MYPQSAIYFADGTISKAPEGLRGATTHQFDLTQLNFALTDPPT